MAGTSINRGNAQAQAQKLREEEEKRLAEQKRTQQEAAMNRTKEVAGGVGSALQGVADVSKIAGTPQEVRRDSAGVPIAPRGGAKIGGSAGKGAAAGASLGTSIMPGWGTAIGAVVGGLGGLFAGIGGNRKDKAEYQQELGRYENEQHSNWLQSQRDVADVVRQQSAYHKNQHAERMDKFRSNNQVVRDRSTANAIMRGYLSSMNTGG